MLSQQEISDRLELQDLITAYSHALDGRRWDEFDDIFTPDAIVDLTATGGVRVEGDLAALKRFLIESMDLMLSSQHLAGTTRLQIDGDQATGRTICHNPMVLKPRPGHQPHVFFVGMWYRDRFVRTPSGWRMAERVQELSYFWNFPGGKPPGAAEFSPLGPP